MTILKFFGEWCNPCKVLSKTMQEAGINHQAIDIDENEELVAKYQIKSVPTVVIVDEYGEEVGRFMGPKTKEQLLEELNKYETSKE